MNKKESLLYKHHLGFGETRVERDFYEESYKSSLSISASQLWTYGDKIPDGTLATGGIDAILSIKNLSDGEVYSFSKGENDVVPLVKKWENVVLTKIDNGTDNSFIAKDSEGNIIKNIIPFNYYEDTYNYYLTSNGRKIYFGVGDWAFDVCSSILTFYGDLPAGIDHNNPPAISFYQYIGGNGIKADVQGFEAAFINLNKIEVSKGQCVTDNIYDKILLAGDVIETGFVGSYGLDGSDDNAGVALSFEKILPVLYSKNHDPVKGYDDSQGQDVQSLLSSKVANASFVKFVSQKVHDGDYSVEFINNTIKINGIGYDIKEGINKIDFSDDAFIIVEYDPNAEDVEDSFTVATAIDEVKALLLYYDPTFGDYLPFVSNEDLLFNTAFAVSAPIGKIPASVKISSNSYQNDFITPDYYGPRVASLVIATDTTPNSKSSDRIVHNTAGSFLEDALFERKSGRIFIRDGVYVCDGNLDLSELDFATIEGENYVRIEANNVIVHSNTILKNLHISAYQIVTNGENIIFDNVFAENSILDIHSTNTIIKDSFFSDVTYAEKNGSKVAINNVTLNTLRVEGDNFYITSSRINTLFIGEGLTGVQIENNIVRNLESKPVNILFDGNYITNYASTIDINEIPHNLSFPFYEASKHRIFIEIEDNIPIFYDASKKKISFRYDEERIVIDENGKISTIIKPSFIVLDENTYQTQTHRNVPDPQTPNITKDENGNNILKTLQDVIKDIYWSKADLVDGKVPLDELPDSVAYGGLSYVGVWDFESHNGEYPTFDDVSLAFSKDKDVSEIQPGWFFIVNPPASEEAKSDSDDSYSPARKQVAIDGQVYTAGDWVIYEADGKWSKADRAFQDACYAILKATDPDGKKWCWKEGGDGLLDLGNATIIEAFDRINEALAIVLPKKPFPASKVKFVIANEETLPKVEYIKVVNGSLTTKESNFDYNKLENVSLTTVGNSRKNLVYFGDSAEVSIAYNGDVKTAVVDTSSDKFEVEGYTIYVKDIYNDDIELFGKENIWLGLSIDTTFEREDIKVGNNSIGFAVDNITPNVDSTFNSSSPITTFKTVKPIYFDDSQEVKNIHYNTDAIGTNALSNSRSGIQLLDDTSLDIEISFDISNFCNECFPTAFEGNVNDYPITSYSLIENLEGTYDLHCSVIIPRGEVSDEHYCFDGMSFEAHIKDIYGNEKAFDLGRIDYKVVNVHTMPVRVTSGAGVYPDVYNTDDTSIGHFFNEKENVKTGFAKNELMFDFTENSYRWPDGEYSWNNNNGGVDYTLTDSGISFGEDTYRFVTFDKNIMLNESSGFTLKIKSKSDFSVDPLTSSTNDMIIQAVVIKDNAPIKPNFDANAPIDGFTQFTGDEDTFPAMFAGSSTALEKRVTFGRRTVSGKLLIRIGLKNNGKSVDDIEVTNIV